MKYSILSAILVMATIIFYVAGLTTRTAGTAVGASLFIAGALCEGFFWTQRKKSRHRD